ncbi:MAG: HD domain-containing protein [Candidatus Coatesbacteria bacterium]|nr:HD domain-containing protein [Candidatus Coatesbacteria bacterium]
MKLTEALPEINLITNEDIRNKVIACFEEALSYGQWQVDDLDKIPFTLLIPNCKVSLLKHTRGVTKSSLANYEIFKEMYGNMLPVDRDILLAGALLHDVGKLLEYYKENDEYKKSDIGKLIRHPFSGAYLALKHGLPEKVAHIIAAHAKEGDLINRIPEAIIIFHSDFTHYESLKTL